MRRRLTRIGPAGFLGLLTLAGATLLAGCATPAPVPPPLPGAGNLAVALGDQLHFPYAPRETLIAIDGKLVSHGEAAVVAVPAGEHVVRVIARVAYRCGLFGPSSTVELRAAWVLSVGAGGGRVDLTLRTHPSPALGFAERVVVRAKPSGAASFADAVYTVWSQTLVTDDRCGVEPDARDEAPTPQWLPVMPIVFRP